MQSLSCSFQYAFYFVPFRLEKKRDGGNDKLVFIHSYISPLPIQQFNISKITLFNHIILMYIISLFICQSIRHNERENKIVVLNIPIGNLLQIIIIRYPLNLSRLTFSDLQMKKKRNIN